VDGFVEVQVVDTMLGVDVGSVLCFERESLSWLLSEVHRFSVDHQRQGLEYCVGGDDFAIRIGGLEDDRKLEILNDRGDEPRVGPSGTSIPLSMVGALISSLEEIN